VKPTQRVEIAQIVELLAGLPAKLVHHARRMTCATLTEGCEIFCEAAWTSAQQVRARSG
jgi:hypothetical protein